MVELDAATKLRVWMAERNLGVKELAATLLVSRRSLSEWRHGIARPAQVHRVALEQMSEGRVPASEWPDKGRGRGGNR
jgi:DNA-binding Xre family transcriptional regulator